MINPAKRILLEGLNRAGYRLLKREEYERLLVTAAEAQQAAQVPQSGSSLPAVINCPKSRGQIIGHSWGCPWRRQSLAQILQTTCLTAKTMAKNICRPAIRCRDLLAEGRLST